GSRSTSRHGDSISTWTRPSSASVWHAGARRRRATRAACSRSTWRWCRPRPRAPSRGRHSRGGSSSMRELALPLPLYGAVVAWLVAAWTFLTTRWVLWTWPASALNYAVLQYFPLIMYLAAAPVAGGGRTSVLLLLIVLQGLVTIYVAVPMLAGLGLIGVARMI